MAKVIAIVSQKGGAGKSTTAANLLHGLALRGNVVLGMDLDGQGHLSVLLGKDKTDGTFQLLAKGRPMQEVVVKARPNLWLIPSNKKTSRVMAMWEAEEGGKVELGALDEIIKPLKKNGGKGLDYIVIDTAPAVGDLQDQALWAADGVIVAAPTDYLGADGVGEAWKTMLFHQKNGWRGKIIGVLPTKHEDNSDSKHVITAYRELYKEYVLPEIHKAVIFNKCASDGKTIFEIEKKTEQEKRAECDYLKLVDYVLEVM